MNEIWLPRIGSVNGVRLVALGDLGLRGPVHRDITEAVPRGPFDRLTLHAGKMRDLREVAYPMLWAHDAKREKHLVVEPDSEGRLRQGMDAKAKTIWSTASRLHFNLDFRLTSQPLGACITPEPAIGGTAWPTVKLHDDVDPRGEEALVLWANTTLGLICSWWKGTRQQQGRARLTISRLPELRMLDLRELSEGQLREAEGIFDEFKARTFLPANEAYRDETRQALDRAVLVDLLDVPAANPGLTPDALMDAVDVLRWQWCSEPSVHGGKKTRPQ